MLHCGRQRVFNLNNFSTCFFAYEYSRLQLSCLKQLLCKLGMNSIPSRPTYLSCPASHINRPYNLLLLWFRNSSEKIGISMLLSPTVTLKVLLSEKVSPSLSSTPSLTRTPSPVFSADFSPVSPLGSIFCITRRCFLPPTCSRLLWMELKRMLQGRQMRSKSVGFWKEER